ncbi:MAG TPA: helix-turn-helix transcriptional regulator [Candidatus Coproplasma excrementigallinarum]|uniref:Helix-turn-helix transcriptional regulator n=1 Tax=Candidatus Coproplasma excrementigallinarum TaxID=2840747 RepID=A0A9D1MIW0_9FIRM|nr:helix-turn-helix transcriptional regulator [Candidatus Coproplasma excrementigallinarum]
MEIEKIKEYMKKNKITYAQLAKQTNLSISTVTKILGGFAKYPRADTMEAIERALGLSDWTAEEKAEGVGKHAITLSADEWEWLELRSAIIEVGGQEMLSTIIDLLKTTIKTNKKK